MSQVLLGKKLAGLAVFTVLCVMLALFSFAPHAAAATTGSISGNVTGVGSGPIQNAAVTALSYQYHTTIGSGVTDALGDYTIAGIPAGDYIVKFSPNDYVHYAQYYDSHNQIADADRVIVSAGGTTGGIDADLPIGGTISGTVLAGDTGLPLQNCPVKVLFVEWHGHQISYTVASDPNLQTDVNGNYSAGGLATGPYEVEFNIDDGLHVLDWWYNDQAAQKNADTVDVVAPNENQHIDVSIPAGGFIDGTVTSSVAPHPGIGSINVTPEYFDVGLQQWVQLTAVATQNDGTYEIGPVQPAQYRVDFTDSANPIRFMSQWYNNKTDESSADSITVAQAVHTTNIDAALVPTGHISGTVKTNDSYQKGIEDCYVYAYLQVGSSWTQVGSAQTQEGSYPDNPDAGVRGTYIIDGLPAGNYQVQFSPTRTLWQGQWYNNQPGPDTATTIPVNPGSTTTNINALLSWSPHSDYAVTNPGFSNYGIVLSSMGINYEQLTGNTQTSLADLTNIAMLKQFKYVFVNCSSDISDPSKYRGGPGSALETFVNQGGKLYVSDLAVYRTCMSGSDFPGLLNFADPAEQGQVQDVTAAILDQGLINYLGANTAKISFDEGGFTAITGTAPTGVSVQMRADVETDYLHLLHNSPICTTLTYGSGKIYCFDFHIDKQDSETAQGILGYFVGKTLPAPSISSINPTSGKVGTQVAIYGSNFGQSKIGNSNVTFNGVVATSYQNWSNSEIDVTVPDSATTGPVIVTNTIGASNSVNFTVNGSDNLPSVFYFAEGTCRPNFDPYICIQNPGTTDANVTITYMKGDGTTDKQDITVPKNARSTVRVADKLGQGNDAAHDFSSKVECTNGQQIIAERPMYFNYNGVWTGGHDVVGATSAASTFYFAEGSCRPNFDPYICIQNPGDSDANVTITYMKGDGTTDMQNLAVAKNSRSTVRVKDRLGEANDAAHDFSSKVECTNGGKIIVERPMYFNYNGVWTGGHDVVGATGPATDFYFAEGTCRPNFDPYICIQNPGSVDASVTITYMKGDGTTDKQDITVPKNSRSTVRVVDKLGQANDYAHDFSSKVSCTNGQQIIAERPMYFNYNGVWTGGHDVVGAASAASTFYFAEGSCRPNFDPYICIQNPGSVDASVTITYMKGDGTTDSQVVSVPRNSRSTVRVVDKLGQANDAAHDFSSKVECTNGQQIIAERPMYFNYNSVWTGGHDVVGYFSK